MALKWILYSSLVLSWAVVLWFLCAHIRRWLKNETASAAAWVIPVVLIAMVALPAIFLSPRAGYDNEHDIMMLSTGFFPRPLPVIMMFKEISPLFTDWVSDIVSGYSINAILWKNRLLQGMSVFVFFLGIRRLGAGLAAAFAAAAFLGLNFLTLLNANTFTSTPANMFIWLVSLLALAEMSAAREIGSGLLAWVMCSIVLVTGARYEFVPVNIFILCVILAGRERAGLREWRRPLNLGILCLFAVLLAAWAFLLSRISISPVDQVGGNLSPLTNFLYQLGDSNFGIFSGSGRTLAVMFVAVSSVLGLAGGSLKRRLPEVLTAFVILAAWTVYFSAIYMPLDQYPLHFMRHQLYFFTPFAYLFALGFAGLEEVWAEIRLPKALLLVLCGVLLALYGALNLRAALRLKPELRTNDRELQFLASARAAWPQDSELLIFGSDDPMSGLLRKYFPVFDACGNGPPKKKFKYRAVREQVFYYRSETCQACTRAQYASFAPDMGIPLKESVFSHRFYTCWENVEARDWREVRIGFYPAVSNKDAAWTLAEKASCLLRSGRAEEAGVLFEKAVNLFPECGNCRYGLASALLLCGREKEAGEELDKAVRFLPACGDPRYLRAFKLAREGNRTAAKEELGHIAASGPDRGLLELAYNLRFGLDALERGSKGAKLNPSEQALRGGSLTERSR